MAVAENLQHISLQNGKRRSRRLLTCLLLAVPVLILATGGVFLSLEFRRTKKEAGATLTAVAELKARQIAEWHRERTADASALVRVPNLIPDSRKEADSSAAGSNLAVLTAYLERFRTTYRYASVAIYDHALVPVIVQPPGSAQADLAASKLMQAALRTGNVTSGDLYRAQDGSIHLDFAAPVPSATEASFGGVVRLQVDALDQLFPLLAGWPSPSESAESLLFRREGETVVYLNPLRHRPGAALNFRLPLHQPSLLAARAVLEPRAGPIEGVDYRGVPSLAVVRPVPGTPWMVLAKIDTGEADAPAKAVLLRLGTGLTLLLAVVGLGIWVLWRKRHLELLRRHLETERLRIETAERLAIVLRHANDALLLIDDDFRVIETNDRASTLYGWNSEELLTLSVQDLRAAETAETAAADVTAARQAEGHVYETVHSRRDGTTFPVEVSARPVEIGGHRYVLELVRDISERKEHERELDRLNRMYLCVSKVNEAIIHATNAPDLAQDVCRILVESGGFKLAWVGVPDASATVIPHAQFGDGLDYVKGIRITVDSSPEGLGPTGTALREGRTVAINDFLSDPAARPWREQAARSGLRSSIALPLRKRGTVTAALMIYASERNYFGDQEIALAEEVASDISFALDVMARDEERRAAEQALKAREEVFSSIVGQALDSIALFDPATGRFVEFNEMAHRGLVYTREEFAALGLAGIQAEHSSEVVRGNVERIRDTGSAAFETRHRHRDGEIRSVHVRARQLVLNEHRYIAAVWTDITERKRAELERQTLLEIMQGVAAIRDTSSFLRLVHEALGRVIYAENFFVLLHDPRTGLFEMVYIADEHDGAFPPAALGRSLSSFVFRSGEALVVSQDMYSRLEAMGEVDPVGTPSPSWLGAPLKKGDRSIGVMAVQDYQTPGRYSERDREFLSSVAAQVAVAIERQQTQEALVENAARLNEAQRIAHVGVCELDLRRNLLLWSDEIYRIFGVEPRSFAATYEAFLDAIHPDDRARVNEAYTQSLKTREPYEIDHRLLLKDGTQKVVHERCETWFDEAGRPFRSVGTVQDITERKAAEAALLASKMRLEEAQALANLGSWEIDLATGVLTRSPEIFRIFERDVAEWDKTTDAFMEAVHPDDRANVEALYRESLLSVSAHEVEHRIMTPAGRVKWVRARWRAEAGPDGKLVRASGTIQDISEHILAREARNLAAAKEAAETANRAKSAFLASMSHEIRTPMNAILGFAQLLMGDTGLTPRQREQLQAIHRGGEHLLALINDVLEMSKIEAGRVTENLAETDIHDLIWDLESMFQLRVKEKGLSLSITRSSDVPRHVVTDEKKLRQILINLMGNAVKFTVKGGLEVRVWTGPCKGSRILLLVDVEDSGPGISGEELPRLFQRFEQTSTGRETSGGTGLGLAISRGFARLLGGDITVRSRVGEGSVFTLSLPVSLGAARAVTEKIEPRRVVGISAGETRRRILVVDDLAENREILRQMLGRVGFEIRTANDGWKALELFSSWRPHLILMDLRMPGMDGLEAIRTIRARETEGRVPIVAVTASAFEEDRRKTEEAGADGFVSKPFRETELLRTVSHCMGIQYVFDVEPHPPKEAAATRTSTASLISGPLRRSLREAVVSADLDRVLALADEIGKDDPETARTIRSLAESFDYERLLAFLAPRKDSPLAM